MSMLAEDLLLFSADAARLLLENGGETYRAEEVAMGIIASQGGAEAECFALTTGLMLSFAGEDGKIHSVTRRIKKHGMNLEKVSRIELMVRDLRADRIDIVEATDRLDIIERMPDRPAWNRMAASAFGAGAFTLLFGGATVDAIAAAVIGAMLSLVILGFRRLRLPEFIPSLAGGAIAAFSSLALQAAGVVIHPDSLVIGVMMLLVPGVAITNAIRDTIAGDLVAGLARGVDAFLTAAAISAGAGGAYALWQFMMPGGLP